jgi:signal transduction histidine kinase
LKFTNTGGHISITGQLIKKKEDLTFIDEEKFVEIVEYSKFGAVEIIVEDTGVGIKVSDQGKLFKLFGFLETT